MKPELNFLEEWTSSYDLTGLLACVQPPIPLKNVTAESMNIFSAKNVMLAMLRKP